MQSIRVFFTVIILSLCFSSCNKKEIKSIDKNIEEIVLLTINENSFPLPPPPKFVGDSIVNSPKNQKTLDSLRVVKLNVALYPSVNSFKITGDDYIKGNGESSENLLKKLSNIVLKERINIDEINKKSQHHILFADSTILKKSKDWKEYDLLFRFSEITLNSKEKSAKAYVGISRSALWGQAFEIVYEKDDNGKWNVVEKISKEIW